MKSTFARWSATLALSGMTMAAQAGIFADSFNVNQDFKSNGVAGTAWSGITTGTNNGGNPSTVATWDANISAAGTLTITNKGGSWDGANDGPFLWKLVPGTGDFTNTVHVSKMDSINYHFAGLMVRDPNSVQNWLYIGLFPEYGVEIDVRDTVSGASTENVNTGSGYVESDSATWRSWLRITRVAGVITTYASVDGATWDTVYQSTRTDLSGDLQVGIFDSTYSANTASAQHQNFMIEGPGVNINTVPVQASGLTATAMQRALNISWTKGAGSDGSIVVVRQSNPVSRQPLDGLTYTGNSVYGLGNDLGETNYVAYVGSGTSLVLTNLTPLVPYTVAVYSYVGAGTATVYALSNAPYMTAAPLGVPSGIGLTFVATNAVAVDDTIQAMVTLYFTGGGQIDVTSASTFSSGNTGLATVSSAGLISGLAAGTLAITANYQSFSASSNLTVVKLAVTDDFSTSRNYLTQGLPGTPWNGLLLNNADLTVGENSSGATAALLANAGITKAGRLTLSSQNSGFSVGAESGLFLYRTVTGDFSISVQLTSFDTLAYHMPGLMVRAPFELSYTENFMQWIGFNEFSIGNFLRRSIAGSYAELYKQAYPAMPFLMIQRETNTFKFYQKQHALDPWILVAAEDHSEYEGVAMQVGLVEQTFSANTGTAEFDNLTFTIPNAITNKAPAAASGLALSSPNLGMVSASWTPGSGSSGSIVVAHPLFPPTRQPVDGSDYLSTANADLSLGVDMGGSNIVVYAGSGSTVLISNLPSIHYSFAVYSYATSNGTNYYNIQSAVTNSIDVLGYPEITTQPSAAITRFVGQSITVTAGATPGGYRWQHGGVDVVNNSRISGATTSVLSLSGLTAGDGGNYTFICSNSLGAVTSTPPTVLTVLVPTASSELSVLADSPVAFWRLNETSGATSYDYVGGFDGTNDPSIVMGVNGPRPADGFAHFETGNLAMQFLGNSSSSVVSFPALMGASDVISNLTVTAWINPSSYPSDREGIVSFLAPANTALRMYGGTSGLSILYNNAVTHTGIMPPLGKWSFVAMVVSPTGAQLYMATNGGWQVFSDTAVRSGISLSGTGYIGSDRAISGRYYEGLIDEVCVFKSALSGAAITNLFNGVVAPPSVTMSIQKNGTGIQLTWPQGTLLESTNILGPWTTNTTATSPHLITSPVGTKFFKVQVR